jgi:tripartite-type tricarboxylate transporter receptor subunit TctC
VCLCATTVLGQEPFPSKMLRMVVPWPPGGPPDVIARLTVAKLAEASGITAIVENRPGATGSIGTNVVVKAAPDGYTVLFTSNQPIVIAPALFRTPYDPVKELKPVAIFGESANVLVIHPSLGIKSVAQLLDSAKAKPGALSFSSAGQGSIGHFCGEMMKHIAGVDMLHVPYQGTGQAVTAVLSGEVSMTCSSHLLTTPHVSTGKLKALGITGLKPSAFLPDTAPLAAQGLKGLAVTAWYGIFAPPGTPQPVVLRLREIFGKVFQDRGVQQKLRDAGIEQRWEEDDSLARIEADLARYRGVVQAAQIKVQ